MNYSQLISSQRQYKYSANISFDLNNKEKYSEYIPDSNTTSILKDLFEGIIDNSNSQSKILYGSYGSGKSHLMTVLSAILSHTNTETKDFEILVERIKKYDIDLAEKITSFVSLNKPFLVVPVLGDSENFDKSVLISIKKSLKQAGISINFKNYFEEALSLVDTWEYHGESLQRLSKICEENGINLSKLKTDLSKYTNTGDFEIVFSGMSYGAPFNSSDGNLTENLDFINEHIEAHYSGLVFVFDEFGRYVEDYGEGIKVKSVQDLAEYCDHSKYNNNLILVSHKQLSLYMDSFAKETSEEWKKIEGRFKEIAISQKFSQSFSMISHVISKTDNWPAFKKKFLNKLEALFNSVWNFKGFVVPAESDTPFEDCYPLHPITLYALDKMSARVAQNNRTIFTYLASDEDNSLSTQLEKLNAREFHFIGLNSIFDYFESNIQSYRSKDVSSIYQKTINALSKVNVDSLEEKILKTICVIQIVADSSVLTANKETILKVVDGNVDEIENALQWLEDHKLIKYMRQYDAYDFWSSSVYDIDEMIREKSSSISDSQVASVLNDEFTNFGLYPYKYNVEFKMNRVLIPIFMTQDEFAKGTYLKRVPEYYDGILAMIFGNDKKIEVDKSKTTSGKVIIVHCYDERIVSETKKYISIKYLKSISAELSEKDPLVEKELEMYLSEEQSMLKRLVDDWRHLRLAKHSVFYLGGKVNCNSEEALSEIASDAMFNLFPKTIKVNNDLINKNNISGAIRLARSKAISYLLSSDDPISVCQLLSPEHSIIRSVLSTNGLIADETVNKYNRLFDGELSGAYVEMEIRNYLKKCEKEPTNLGEIYSVLKSSPYGLRDGYIPVLFANQLKQYSNVFLSFHGQEKELTAETLLSAFQNVNEYSLSLSRWTAEQDRFIGSLEQIFAGYLGSSSSRLKDLFMAMNRHYSALPKSARTTTKFVSETTKKYREIMSSSYKNYSKFFFVTLAGLSDDLTVVSQYIEEAKYELEQVVFHHKNYAISCIKNLLGSNDESIAQSLKKIYNQKWRDKKHIAFDYQTNSVLNWLDSLNKETSNEQVVEQLSNILLGFEVEYWNDEKIDELTTKLSSIMNQIESHEVKLNLEEGEMKVTIQKGGKDEVVKQFDRKELTTNAKMMFNKMKSTLDNFGQSISYEEKIQIITMLFEEMK